MSPSQWGEGSGLKPCPYLHEVIILCSLLEFCTGQECQKSTLPLLPSQVPEVIWTAELWQENCCWWQIWLGVLLRAPVDGPSVSWRGRHIGCSWVHRQYFMPLSPEDLDQKKITAKFSWSLLYSHIGPCTKKMRANTKCCMVVWWLRFIKPK